MQDTRHDSDSSGDITLVIGGTGKTGRRVAERLQARGHATRIASRAAHPPFDWNDRTSWELALEGVSSAYVSYAPDLAIPGAADAIRGFVARAVEKGVQRLVLLSGRGEEEAQACERIVQQADIAWTIVRASWFNQNFSEGAFLDMVRDGVIALPAGDVREPFVDADDIAEVAVAALTEAGHEYEVYEVTGPRLLTFTEAATEISKAAGREVRFEQIPREVFADAAAESGAPDGVVWLLDYLFATVLDGRNAYLADGVRRALGREPTDFSDFAQRMAARGIWNTGDNEVAA